MDTRSVVRSRRRSSRLTGQPPQGERVKRAAAGKRRDSDYNTSSRASSDASREGSAAHTSPVSKSSSSNGAHQAPVHTRATKAVVKTEDEETALPLFPRLRSSRAKPTQAKKVETDRVAAQSDESVETSSDEAIKGNAKAKAIMTGRRSTRLAIGSSEDNTKNREDQAQVEVEVEEEQDDSFITVKRRSRRLTSKTPDVEHDTIVVEPLPFHPAASETGETQAAATKGAEDGARGFTAEQESGPDLRNPSTRTSSEREPSTDPIHHEVPPRRNLRSRQLLQDSRAAQDTSPIRELLADIEKIVQSSPLAGRASAGESTKGPAASTPGVAGKKRAPASVATRSRSLRRSSRLGSEHTDSETSQFDGAFDDSIQGRREKKAQAASDSTGIAPPKMARGTKRSVEEMAQDEGNSDTQRPRQRRKAASGSVSKSAKKPTPVEASSMNEPDGDDTSNVGESAREDDEAEDSITVAPLPIIHVEEEDDPVDLTAAAEGSSQEAPQNQEPEEDEEKCADCGATRERYLVCAKCQKAFYCGKYCQIWNWPVHKHCCVASEGAVEAEVAEQEAYLGEMWSGALRALEEGENNPGGMLESMLLGEAVGGSPTRGGLVGERVAAGGSAGLDGLGLGGAQSVVPDHAPVDAGRAMSIRLAQAGLGEAE